MRLATALGFDAPKKRQSTFPQVRRTYDARNRLTTLAFPDGNGNQSWSYTADGLPATVTTSNNGEVVTNSWSYNRRRLPTAESVQPDTSQTFNLAYGYNALAQVTSETVGDGVTLTYAVNALGQVTQVKTGATTLASNASYYPNGALAQFTYGNGIVHTITQNARQLPSRSVDGSVLDLSTVFDENGNVAAITDNTPSGRQTRSMSYDALDRLTQTTSPMFGTASYAYDPQDNLTRVQVTGGSQPRDHYYCYNANNQLAFVRSGPNCTGTASPAMIALGYDLQGNLSFKNGARYAFDYGNRLRSTAGQSYRYDAQGRRVRQDVAGSQLQYSQYAADGRLVWQRDEVANQRIANAYLAGSLLAEISRPLTGTTTTIHYLHTDALGSPIAKTSSTGAIIETSEYEPYGRLLNRANDNRAGYTGHVMDAVSGLAYMQQRYYDPSIGRFLSVDPVTANSVSGSNFNRYWYGADNPYRFIDPDGRSHLEKRNDEYNSVCWGERRRTSQERISQAKRDAARARHGKQQSTQQKTGFSTKGLLAGKPAVTATGLAAAGGGVQVTKGIYNSDSSAGIVTPALGLTASVDVNLISVSYTGTNAKQAPVEMRAGFNLEGHALFGGRISMGYTPPSTFEFSIDAGAGLGAAFHVFEINAVIDED